MAGQVTLTARLVGFDSMQVALARTRVGIESLGKSATKLGSSLKAAGDSLTSFGKRASLFVTAPLVGAGIAATKFASDVEEASNKAQVTFNKSAQSVLNFAQTSARSFGIAKSDALDYSATLGVILKGSGFAENAAAGMSVEMVRLAADLASFNNIPIDQALEKLRAGLVGETEPLRTVGVLLSEAAVQNKAMELGLIKSKKELTDQIKVQARYAIIMDQTRTAQGDFTRTADGIANSTRIMRAELKDAAADIGALLLPIATEAVLIFRQLLKRFTELSPETKTMILIMAGVAAVVGPLVVSVGLLVSGIGGLVTAFGALLGVVTGIVIPLGLILLKLALILAAGVSLGLVVAGLAKSWKDFGSLIAELSAGPLNILTATIRLMSEMITEGPSVAWENFKSTLGDSVSTIKTNVSNIGRNIRDTFVEAKDYAIDSVGRLVEGAKGKLGDLKDSIKASLMGGVEEGSQGASEILKAGSFTVKGAKPTFGMSQGDMAAQAKKDIDDLRAAVADFGKQMASADPASKAFADMVEGIRASEEAMRKLDPVAADAFAAIADAAWLEMARAGNAAVSTLDQMAVGISDWAEESAITLQTWGSAAEDIFNTFKEGVGDAVAEAIVEGEDLGAALQNVLKNVAKAVISTLIQIAIQKLVNLAISLLINTAEGTAQGATAVGLAGANAYASTAAIPIVGPALAPAAAAAAIAGATAALQAGAAAGAGAGAAAGAAAGGLEDVPQTGTFLLHKGERVIQRKQNMDLAAFLDGGAAGGGAVAPVINFNAPVNFSDEIEEKRAISRMVSGLRNANRRRR